MAHVPTVLTPGESAPAEIELAQLPPASTWDDLDAILDNQRLKRIWTNLVRSCQRSAHIFEHAAARPKLLVTVSLLIGFGLRFFLAAAYHGNFDEDSYEIVVGIMQRGGNIYTETARYNYSPAWALVLFGLNGVAGLFG